MEPRIQYAKTADGVSIAYWTLGEGLPFVHLPWFRASHAQLEWRIPEYRAWYESLATNRQLIRYDGRGIGMSDREATDYSLDALVSDLEAVVDRLGLQTFALFGLVHGGPVAIAYAARHPERISHLLLWCAYARAIDYAQSAAVQATRGFLDTDWELYTETLAHIRLGWSENESARHFAALIRESITPEVLKQLQNAYRDLDVTALLPGVQAPTLVLHRRQLPWLGIKVPRDLAAAIPNAEIMVLEGSSGAPFLDDPQTAVNAIDNFLGLPPATVAPARSGSQQSAFQTVLFTDIEGSTALTERLGDAGARDVLREYERTVREALESHSGSEIKHTGDGFMASFGSATKALECAVAIQEAFEKRGVLRVRIGVNAGEPVAEDGDLFGTAVNLAARIAGQALGREVLVTDVVRQLVAGKGFSFTDRGEHSLKGLEEPVRVFELRWNT